MRTPACALIAVLFLAPLTLGGDKDKPAQKQADKKRPQAAQKQIVQVQIGGAIVGKAAGSTGLDVLDSGLIPADRTLLINLKKARDLIADKHFAEGFRFLQQILEAEEDATIPPEKDGQKLFRSLKLEAQRIIGALPPEGREAYELWCGSKARTLLKEAIERGDYRQMERVARDYFHTKAGREASYRLGVYHRDHDRPLAAALCFRRLTVAVDDPLLFLNASACWHRAGMEEEAVAALESFKQGFNRKQVWLAGAYVPLWENANEALPWLQTHFRKRSSSGGPASRWWSMFRGNPARTAAAIGGPPAAVSAWDVPTSQWKSSLAAPFGDGTIDASRQIAAIEEDYHEDGLPAVPAGTPLVVNDRVLVRTCTNLKAYDLATGELAWEAMKEENPLEKVWKGEVPELAGNRGSVLDPLLKQRLFTDGTYARLSASGDKVFCVQDLGFVAALNPSLRFNRSPNQTKHPLSPEAYNRLTAYDLKTGKLKWEVGGPLGDASLDLAGHFFLGSPLPLAGRLYALAEVGQMIHLVVLDPRTGEVDWTQTLIATPESVEFEPDRRQAGLTPSYADGILICPTGAGYVVALDLAQRSLMWVYDYREEDKASPQDKQRILLMRMVQARQGNYSPNQHKPQWLDGTPTISQGHVVITPHDSEKMHCLRLLDGSVAWKAKRENRQFVDGIYEGGVIVVGKEEVELLGLTNGRRRWRCSVPLPSGRGYRTGGRYHLPLSTQEIVTLDLNTGQIPARTQTPDGVPGSLVSAGGFVLSHGPARLRGIPAAAEDSK